MTFFIPEFWCGVVAGAVGVFGLLVLGALLSTAKKENEHGG